MIIRKVKGGYKAYFISEPTDDEYNELIKKYYIVWEEINKHPWFFKTVYWLEKR